MRTKEADDLGNQVTVLVEDGHPTAAYTLLAPVLVERTPFTLLDRIGARIGAGSLETVNAFLPLVVEAGTLGGWPVVGQALRQQLNRDLMGALNRYRVYTLAGDTWYATDILGERVD